MLNVEELLIQLGEERPVFHSEADFQHALAWQLHLRYPNAELRLEKVFASSSRRLHIDVCCVIDEQTYIFELKYKTCSASLSVASEEFNLQNHSAQPPSRYDFVKDIARLEAAIGGSARPMSGFAIFLTNDRSYWSKPRRTGGVSDAFSIHEGQRLWGELIWGPGASAGTKKNREEPIALAAEYRMNWRDYSKPDAQALSRFRYLCVPVIRQP